MALYEYVPTAEEAAHAGGPAGVHHFLADLARRGAATEYRLQRRVARWSKRALDLVVGIPLMVAFLLVAPLIGAVVAFTSPGPVIFKQQRTGRGGRQFSMYKFRTMHTDSAERLERDPELKALYLENGYKIPAEMDPRITSVGRVLRKLSLDELPQIVNVVLGHMSLVGPRPVLADEAIELYGDHVHAYLAARPGLTGPWQVSGRSEITGEGRVELDRSYLEEWSLLGDVVILARTVPAVLTARGAY